MKDLTTIGWKQFLSGFPWFEGENNYPLRAYSEFMPPPRLGINPYDGTTDKGVFDPADPWGWKVLETEEEEHVKPGMSHACLHIAKQVNQLGTGSIPVHLAGHKHANLVNNPFWPKELASPGLMLSHERYITFQPFALSKTKDDKGRICWTFFGASEQGPEKAFWKSFYDSPEHELPESVFMSLMKWIFDRAYGIVLKDPEHLAKLGFRILPSGNVFPFSYWAMATLPSWTKRYMVGKKGGEEIKYLLTFCPFGQLPDPLKKRYLSGKLHLLPFPGSLVPWGAQEYVHLQETLYNAIQVPLLRLVKRNEGHNGLRVPQSGWLHEPKIAGEKAKIMEEFLVSHYVRTSRWDKFHKHEDALLNSTHVDRVMEALFSTTLESLDLYNKPMARNCQLFDENAGLLLDGPHAGRDAIEAAALKVVEGGLFSYRFYFPAMLAGRHEVFWHRPLVGCVAHDSGKQEINAGLLTGYLTAYNAEHPDPASAIELWPRIVQAEPLHHVLKNARPVKHGILTYGKTANREYEEHYWNQIHFLAHGEYIHKDNADIIQDPPTLERDRHAHRDLHRLGDFLIAKHTEAIHTAGMEGKAEAGELPFTWETDFEFTRYGGWKANQEGKEYERDILVIIPGKNRKEAIVMADHYDTAYMADEFYPDEGGTGGRFAAAGADDNHSATTTLLLAAPIFLEMAKQGRLERDIWLLHLTGEEFPSDCMGARNFCKNLMQKTLKMRRSDNTFADLSDITVKGVLVMDMIAHNRDNAPDIFQISPGNSPASLELANEAYNACSEWNARVDKWNASPDRKGCTRGRRTTDISQIPEKALHLRLEGQVRTWENPDSTLYNTDGIIFSDTGIPVILFMENYDINRTGYHDSHDTMENIDLDYGAAVSAIAIETVARLASACTDRS